MKWASVANQIVHPLLQLFEIPSQDSANFLSRVLRDVRTANYRNCVLCSPCIAPDASSAPTPNCCRAASIAFFVLRQYVPLSNLIAWKPDRKTTLLFSEMPEKWECGLKKAHHIQTHATLQKSPPRTLSTHALPKHAQRRNMNRQVDYCKKEKVHVFLGGRCFWSLIMKGS